MVQICHVFWMCSTGWYRQPRRWGSSPIIMDGSCFEPGMWIWPKGFQCFLCKLWKIYIGFHPSHHVNDAHMTNNSPCWPPEPSTEVPPSSPKTIRGWNSLPMSGPLNERRRRHVVQICLTDPTTFVQRTLAKYSKQSALKDTYPDKNPM